MLPLSEEKDRFRLGAVVLVRGTIGRSLRERSFETSGPSPHYVIGEVGRVFVQLTSGNVGVQVECETTDDLGNGELLAQCGPRSA